jgi:peroxiredoxin
MDIGALAAATVLAPDGSTVRLADQWAERATVVVWLRHFGCIFCREQVAEMRAARADFEALDAGIVFVGNGTARAAMWFQKRFAPDATVLTDPDLVSYRAIGARSGVLSTLGPQAWGAGVRAFRAGARQSVTRGHPYQQGGLVVMGPGNVVIYRHISSAAGDHPPLSKVFGALRAAKAHPAGV